MGWLWFVMLFAAELAILGRGSSDNHFVCASYLIRTLSDSGVWVVGRVCACGMDKRDVIYIWRAWPLTISRDHTQTHTQAFIFSVRQSKALWDPRNMYDGRSDRTDRDGADKRSFYGHPFQPLPPSLTPLPRLTFWTIRSFGRCVSRLTGGPTKWFFRMAKINYKPYILGRRATTRPFFAP